MRFENIFLWVLILMASNPLSSECLRVHVNKHVVHNTKGFGNYEGVSMANILVNVNDYLNDQVDTNKGFSEAWNSACKFPGGVFEVPKGQIYRLKPIIFSGPCQPNLTIKIEGEISASVDRSDYENSSRHWIMFQKLDNFVVEGGGIINGNGELWWKKSCKVDKSQVVFSVSQPCTRGPTALTFDNCKNFVVSNLKLENAQQVHVKFSTCDNVQVENLRVTAPGQSPNTDGIHITETQNTLISNSVIGTGDDCISIVSGSRNVTATNIICSPGHGISIGSLGEGNSEDRVSDVFVRGAKLSGTTNGVRIKTWQGGSGYAKNFVFEDITMRNVTNPIIIDQNYCDRKDSCPEQKSAVQVSRVTYRNIKGTTASKVAMKFDCSKTHPCQGILLDNIDLKGQSGGRVTASCANARIQESGKVSPRCR